MMIISRYILSHFLSIFVLALLTFVALYLFIDFFEKIDDLIEKHVTIRDAAFYFGCKLPLIVTQGIPMAALLSSLISLGLLKRNRELVALEAAGVKPAVYVRPIVVAALCLALLHLALGETMARSLNQAAQGMWKSKILNKPTVSWHQQNVWYHGDGVIYQIMLMDRTNQVMEKASLFFINSDFKLDRRLDAKRVKWESGKWVAEDCLLVRFNGTTAEQERTDRIELTSLRERPEDFLGLETIPEELSWPDLYEYTDKIRTEGYNPTPYEVELHTRAAFPMTTLILAILGVTIVLRQGIHGGIATGIGIALTVAFAYLTVLQVGSGLASAGILPPMVGAWAGNVIFTALAGYLWVSDY
ncbi:MAG: LPS export ABC transporter permease LptG [Acidobacteriota bacterium]